mgnify:CR=1 FL=1
MERYKYPDDFINKIICGDCLEVLKQIPDESVNCCITSPPYWALRDYEVEGQLGLEPTFDEYLNNLIIIFDEVRRVLRRDGTCWVVIGDTYGGSFQGTGGTYELSKKQKSNRGSHSKKDKNIRFKTQGPDKCLLQIPARFAIMMIDRGWLIRNEIIWRKPNVMPSSVKDRFTIDYEKVYFFTKNKKYWFEQQFEEYAESSKSRMKYPRYTDNSKGASRQYAVVNKDYKVNYGRNKRCVWDISTKPFKGPHYATFPPDLIEPMIKAGCPDGGIVLDPFLGSGTTALVAKQLGRDFIGIELNSEYCKMAEERIEKFDSVVNQKRLGL